MPSWPINDVPQRNIESARSVIKNKDRIATLFIGILRAVISLVISAPWCISIPNKENTIICSSETYSRIDEANSLDEIIMLIVWTHSVTMLDTSLGNNSHCRYFYRYLCKAVPNIVYSKIEQCHGSFFTNSFFFPRKKEKHVNGGCFSGSNRDT